MARSDTSSSDLSELTDISEDSDIDQLVEELLQRSAPSALSPTHSATPYTQQRRRVTRRIYRRRRMSTTQKLQGVIDYLRSIRWSLRKLIKEWVSTRENTEARLVSKNYATVALRRTALRAVLEDSEIRTAIDDSEEMGINITAMFRELDTLPEKSESLFGKWTGSHTVLDNLDFDAAFEIIRSTAPSWYTMITALLRNRRSHWSSGYTSGSVEKSLTRRLYFITAFVLHSRMSNTSSMLPSLLSLYLQGTGTKRRVVETLFGLGICQSYYTGVRLLKTVADESKVCIY